MLPTLSKLTATTVSTAIKPILPTLNNFKYFLSFNTRWSDNDMYGHLNNVKYIEYTDAIVNEFLINHCQLNPHSLIQPVGLVINSGFTYRSSLNYPNPIIAALAVSKLGKSSVTYSVALFDSESNTLSKETNEPIKGLGSFISPPQQGEGGEGKWKDLNLTLSLRLKERHPAAYGSFTHVYVDPISRKSVPIPEGARRVLEKLVV